MQEERTIDRDDAVREMIELAVSLFINDQSWASAATLTRAAQQYLHEKLQSQGLESTLAKQHAFLRDEHGAELDFKAFKNDQVGFANLLKHSKDPSEPSTFKITANQIGRNIELAIADYSDAVGSPSAPMIAFVMNRLIANTGAGAKDRSSAVDTELERLKSIPGKHR